MTVYSELLRMALDSDGEIAERSTEELVTLVISRHQKMLRANQDSLHFQSETPLVNSLAYDAALVQLCRRLGIEQTLTQHEAGLDERRVAEKRLVEQLPELAGVLH